MLPLNVEFDDSYKDFFFISVEEYVKRPKTKLKLKLVNRAIKKYFPTHIKSFKELILASPEIIEKLVIEYEQKDTIQKNVIDNVLNMTTLYSAFTTDKFFTNSNNTRLNSQHHFKKIDFEVCPYCNEGKIVSWIKKIDGTIKRNYDWDHFIPKDAYPFLGISIYNLIPSCKVCNFLKLDTKKVGLNPHNKYSVDELLTFSVKASNLQYFESIDEFEIVTKTAITENGKKLYQNLKTIYLEERYSESKQMLKFFFRKHRSYSRSTLYLMSNLFGVLDSRHTDYFEKYFGIYTTENQYKHMPYSKLITDTLFKKNKH